MTLPIFMTPHEEEQSSFNQASSGTLRGRESFCKLLDTIEQFQEAGLNPECEETNITRQNFQALLHAKYRQAARENYEDSTEERFSGSGRPPREALSDLHLVPVYMELSGLDPEQEQSWTECGINHNDYISVYNARRIDEAARIWELIQNREKHTASNIAAHENILTLLKEAGLNTAEEKTYTRIKATKQEFERYLEVQKNLRNYPYTRPSFT